MILHYPIEMPPTAIGRREGEGSTKANIQADCTINIKSIECRRRVCSNKTDCVFYLTCWQNLNEM